MRSGIYKIVNKINNKLYIGSAVNFKNRWNSHLSDLRRGTHSNNYLQNAWNKYGEDSFEFKVIEIVNRENLLEREQYWIDKLNVTNKDIGYNIALFAESPMKGRKHSSHTLKKISVSSTLWHQKHRGTEKYQIYLQNLSISLTGRKYNDEARKAISESRMGKFKGKDNPFFGKKHDDSTIRKMSLIKSKLNTFQIKEIKILLEEGEKPQDIAELFETQHTNILSIKNHNKYDWIIPEKNFNVSEETRSNLLNLKRHKEIIHRAFTNELEVKKIKKLLFIEKQRVSDIARVFNTYDEKIRDIKKGKYLQWVSDYELVDVTDELFKIDIYKYTYYLNNGKLTTEDLIAIYKLKEQGMQNYKIAQKFNVSEGTVGNVLKNKSIKNVVTKYINHPDWSHKKYISMAK